MASSSVIDSNGAAGTSIELESPSMWTACSSVTSRTTESVKTVTLGTLPDRVRLKTAAEFRPLVRNPLFGGAVCPPGSSGASRASRLLTPGAGNTPLLPRAGSTASPLVSALIAGPVASTLLVVLFTSTLLVGLSALLTDELRPEYSVLTLFPGA